MNWIYYLFDKTHISRNEGKLYSWVVTDSRSSTAQITNILKEFGIEYMVSSEININISTTEDIFKKMYIKCKLEGWV